MKYEDYKKKRDELIDEADKLIDAGKIHEANSVLAEIRKMDTDLANERSFEDHTRVTDIYSKSVQNIKDATLGASFGINPRINNCSKGLFLNKGDKLADRVEVSENEMILLDTGALGNVVRGMVTGKWTSPELKNAVTTTATGTLIPEILSAKVIDRAREISLFTNAGVPTVPMDSNNITISRVKTDPQFSFKKEGEEGTEASFELDSVELKSKTAYGYAYVTIEAINSSQNLDGILLKVFSEAMANAIDKCFIYGQSSTTGTFDSFAPGGIVNDTAINSITATASAGYDDFIKAIGKVRKANGEPTVYGINSETEELLSLLKTTEGQYLEEPKALNSLKKIVSNQLNYSSTDGSDALVFDPNALLVGIQNNIQIKIIEDGQCLKKGLIGFQIMSMLDCKTVIPKHVCKITGIK